MQKALKIKPFQDIGFALSRCRSVSAAGFFVSRAFFRTSDMVGFTLWGKVCFLLSALYGMNRSGKPNRYHLFLDLMHDTVYNERNTREGA